MCKIISLFSGELMKILNDWRQNELYSYVKISLFSSVAKTDLFLRRPRKS